MKATPGRNYLKDPDAGWWQHFSTLLIRYASLVMNDKDTDAQHELRKHIQAKLIQLDSDEFHRDHFGPNTDPEEVNE